MITNVVPLCHACHMAAHTGRNLTEYKRDAGTQGGGRPPKIDDHDAFMALDLLVAGKIGVRKCKSMMNIRDSVEPKQTSQYKRWAAARGIRNIRNTLDAAITNSPYSVKEGRIIGHVEYVDGKELDISFDDVGLNDDMLYTFRGYDDGPMTFVEFLRKYPKTQNDNLSQDEVKKLLWASDRRNFRYKYV